MPASDMSDNQLTVDDLLASWTDSAKVERAKDGSFIFATCQLKAGNLSPDSLRDFFKDAGYYLSKPDKMGTYRVTPLKGPYSTAMTITAAGAVVFALTPASILSF